MLKSIYIMKFFIFSIIIFYFNSIALGDTPNVFDKNRMSSEGIMSGWLSCKEKQSKVTNEVTASHFCACMFDWVRTVFNKEGNSGLLNISKNKKLNEIGNECHTITYLQPANSFGRGAQHSNFEPSVLGTSSVVSSQMGCLNEVSTKPLRYKMKLCGCISDYSRVLYRQYGKSKFLNSIVNQEGIVFKKFIEKEKYCDKYAKN